MGQTVAIVRCNKWGCSFLGSESWTCNHYLKTAYGSKPVEPKVDSGNSYPCLGLSNMAGQPDVRLSKSEHCKYPSLFSPGPANPI
jgi:hypothetical protein